MAFSNLFHLFYAEVGKLKIYFPGILRVRLLGVNWFCQLGVFLRDLGSGKKVIPICHLSTELQDNKWAPANAGRGQTPHSIVAGGRDGVRDNSDSLTNGGRQTGHLTSRSQLQGNDLETKS